MILFTDSYRIIRAEKNAASQTEKIFIKQHSHGKLVTPPKTSRKTQGSNVSLRGEEPQTFFKGKPTRGKSMLIK